MTLTKRLFNINAMRIAARNEEYPPRSTGKAGILKEARRLFARYGYYNCSITDIAAAARVNRALIYYYFKNKEDIYVAVIDDVLRGVLRLWEIKGVKEGVAEERLDAYLFAFARLLRRNRDVIPLMLREVAGGGRYRGYILKNYLLPNFTNLVKLLEEGKRRGAFSKVTPAFSAVALLSGVIMPAVGPAADRRVAASVGASGDYWDQYLKYYKGYVRRALGATSGGR